jgi:dTDP-4-dehydrorhamnose reductase
VRILITGSTGLLGTALTMKCGEQGIPFVGVTRGDVDITEKQALERWVDSSGCDTVINTAALVGVTQCESEPARAFATNSLAVTSLAEICRRRQMTLVQISTHTVFDGDLRVPYLEDLIVPNPLNTYGASKYIAELNVRNNCSQYYIVRLPTLFGPRRNSHLGFPDKVIQWIREGKSLRIADDKIDSPSYSLDVAERILTVLRDQMAYGVYHVANDGAVSFYDFVLQIVKIMGARVEVQRAKDAEFQPLARNPLRTAMGSLKLPRMRDWREALEEYLQTWVMKGG